ncbi:hypothetical protein [Georgenia wangjunii]|uniref:hypothetical protein n=1 Tax=Georgenia wangjunii TaxID=3117730 RepID=UPI002F2681BF
MSNWRSRPWWAWLLVGLVVGTLGGWLLKTSAAGAPSGPARPALQEAIAWQGWMGSALGALASLLVALLVLRVTLATESRRFEEQRTAEDKRFEQQRFDDSERARKQATAVRLQAVMDAKTERLRAWEMRRLEVWSDLIAQVREYLQVPVDTEALRALEQRATASLYQWRLCADDFDAALFRGIEVALGDIIGAAHADAQQAREDRWGKPKSRREASATVRFSRPEQIGEFVERGSALHSNDATSRADAIAWFTALAKDRPRLQ